MWGACDASGPACEDDAPVDGTAAVDVTKLVDVDAEADEVAESFSVVNISASVEVGERLLDVEAGVLSVVDGDGYIV